MPRLRDRSVSDIVVLLVTGTICFTILASGAAAFILELFRPQYDDSAAIAGLTSLIGSLISVLAGFVAGHSAGKVKTQEKQADGSESDQ